MKERTYKVSVVRSEPHPSREDPLGSRGFVAVKISCVDTKRTVGDFVEFSDSPDDGTVKGLVAKMLSASIVEDVAEIVRNMREDVDAS